MNNKKKLMTTKIYLVNMKLIISFLVDESRVRYERHLCLRHLRYDDHLWQFDLRYLRHPRFGNE